MPGADGDAEYEKGPLLRCCPLALPSPRVPGRHGMSTLSPTPRPLRGPAAWSDGSIPK